MEAQLEVGTWRPTTKSEKAAVWEELERLLSHPYFNQSKRYPQFLRFVVTHALGDDEASLKERVLGFEIFGRLPDYDTATDPVVRVTATEIRKRLILYYQQPEHREEIKIVLPPGSYSPRFYLADESKAEELIEASTVEEPLPVQAEVPEEHAAVADRKLFPRRRVIAAGTILAVLCCTWLVWRDLHRSSPESFWSPLFLSKEPVLFCIPDQMNNAQLVLWDTAEPRHQTTVAVRRNETAMTDLPPLLNLVGLMQVHKRAFRVKGTSSTGLDDMREADTVLIGSFNDPWTLRFTQPLRFHFANDPEMKRLWIADRENPNKIEWSRDTSHLYQDSYYEDYAILARFLNPDTGRWVVIVGGLGHGATLAAGEFLVSEKATDELMRRAPRGWRGQGMEAVLKTSVAGDESGAPHIVATYFW